jgi:hypothetical protein
VVKDHPNICTRRSLEFDPRPGCVAQVTNGIIYFIFWQRHPLVRVQRVAAVSPTQLAAPHAEDVVGNVIRKWRFWMWRSSNANTSVVVRVFVVALTLRKATEADSLALASTIFWLDLGSDPENGGDALPKRRAFFELHGRTTHETILFTFTSVTTANITSTLCYHGLSYDCYGLNIRVVK